MKTVLLTNGYPRILNHAKRVTNGRTNTTFGFNVIAIEILRQSLAAVAKPCAIVNVPDAKTLTDDYQMRRM